MGVSSIFNLGKTFHDQTTGKILLISLLFLFLVIALVISIHIYAKWCLLRSPEPDSIHSSTSLPSAATTVVIRRYRRDAVARRGLDRRVLKAIPVLVLEGEKGSECAVCLCEVAEGEKYRVLPKCGHGFHVDCIDMWFASHTTCPLCRDTVSVPGLSLVKKQRSEVNLDAILETARAENAAMFPTNVLFWGNQMQVSTHTLTPTEEDNTRATSSGTVAIDMPRQAVNEEEEQSGAVTTRLRSLKRMLSRDRKINPCSPSNDATRL